MGNQANPAGTTTPHSTPPVPVSTRAGGSALSTHPTLTFPVIRGIQAGHAYYVAMWSLRTLRQISIFDEQELPPELRVQRTLNKSRIPEIAGYILDNPNDYVFSALTVSIDSEIVFEPLVGQDMLGVIRVPMDAKFIINDGQHRRAAIIEALNSRPELANETIAVVFFLDIGLERCQQMFADLNRHAIRPSRSLGLLYDHRNDRSRLTKLVIMKSDLFREVVDMEKSSLARRSRKLFTLSSFCNATADLLQGIATGDLEQDATLARTYWETIAKHFPSWQMVREGRLAASEVREGFIHSHGIAIHALGLAGNELLRQYPQDWPTNLSGLAKINWSRNNAQQWEGRALIAGRVSKVSSNVTLTANVIKQALGLKLSKEEKRAEEAFKKGKN